MKKKILIADDSPTIVAIIKDILTEAGYDTIEASDGQAALEKAKKERPDLIILDLMLPKIDGYKVCAMLKFDRLYEKIPVIILTARGGESDKEMGEEVKANAYITKPFETQALLNNIKTLLK